MAVKSGDAQYAAKLFDQIGDQWNQSTWQTRQIFDDRKAWAAKTAEIWDALQDAYQAVDLSERSPEGKAYQRKIATLLGSPQEGPFSQCFAQARESAPVFEVLLKIAKDGTVKRHVFFPDLVPVACMGAKLATLVFPAPPADDYWVRVSMQMIQQSRVGGPGHFSRDRRASLSRRILLRPAQAPREKRSVIEPVQSFLHARTQQLVVLDGEQVLGDEPQGLFRGHPFQAVESRQIHRT
jgi:hypothetical protein